MAQLIRIMRGSLLEMLGQQYITTARAKGLKEKVVINKYAVRVAINPLISVMGMQLPSLISRRHRAGHRAVAADHRPAVHARPAQPGYVPGRQLLAVPGLMLMVGNLLADIALAWVDPRIRLE